MRLAIVAASSYEASGQVAPIPNAEIDVELFGRRLAEADAGFSVNAFSAERGLAEAIGELVKTSGGRARSLVFYFWGYALLSPERGPALLLDGPKLAPLTFARLRRLLTEVADESLVVLDATLADTGEPLPSDLLDVVKAMGPALGGRNTGISSLIALRPSGARRRPGPPPFTGLLQMLLDAHSGSDAALTPETLFRAMQAEEVMFADIPAAGCFLAPSDFVLVPPAAPLSAVAAPLARVVTAKSIAPPPPPPPLAAPALPVLPPPPPVPLPPPSLAAPPPPLAALAAPPVDATRVRGVHRAVAPAGHAPDDPAGYRFLLGHFERKGDVDAAYRAAQCLDALGEADINESMLVSTHRPDGLQAVRATLSYADWNERLCRGFELGRTRALLRAIAPALPSVGFQHVRRQRREQALPEDTRHELERSTTMLAKTLHWASRLLCVPTAELYVLPELTGSLGLVPAAEQPLMACARALGSGFSLPELVFLWSRELAFARPEEAVLCYFSNVTELGHLLSAALAVGGVISLRAIDSDAKRLASSLKREVRGAALAALEAAASVIQPHEVAELAREFVRGAELTAGRVGLVASGSLEAALALSQRFPRRLLTPPAELRADLLRFTVSPELGQIRAALGVAVG